MGADMLIAIARQPYAAAPVYTDEQIQAGAKLRLAFVVNTLTDPQIIEDCLMSLGLETPVFEEGRETEWLNTTRRTLHGELSSWLDALIAYRRDVSSPCLQGAWYWMTGGLSWGDSPTDSFDAIAVLDDLCTFDEPLTEQELNPTITIV